MSKVADYDTYDYDYSTYWSKRKYEHEAESLVLKKLLKNEKGKWFLDVGGSFGRLTDSYYKKYSKSVIADYSLKTLQKNYKELKNKYPNIELIAANAYFLPFKDNVFDGALMVRVLHHIEDPQKCISEIFRTQSDNGIYIQEFANKIHIKASIKALFTLNFSFFNISPYQQPDKHHYEGTKKGSHVLFLNYHPKYIHKILTEAGYIIEKKYGCSFLRINILKKIFKTDFLLFWENIFQNILSFTNFSPSIFIKAVAKKESNKKEDSKRIEDILVCPQCKGELEITSKKAVCRHCKKEYIKKDNIWDFRV